MTKSGILRPVVITGLILAAGASLTACQKKAESDAAGFGASGIEATRTEDKFGKNFGNVSRASPNSEPAEVEDGDLAPVSDTAEPEQID